MLLALLPALALMAGAPSAFASPTTPSPAERARLVPQDEVIVFAPQVGAEEAWSSAIAAGLEPLTWNEALGALTVRSAASGLETTTASEALSSLARVLPVRFSEPDVPATLQGIGDDPLFDQQWALTRIDATEAWTQAPDASDIVVAVLDSGVALGHEDLAGQLLAGTDIYDGDSDPSDAFGHGTLIAGIVGAAADNGLGVAGVAPGVRVLPVKITNDGGGTSYSRIASGITWAADHGADVITISSGATVESELLANAVSYARDRDVIVVAAAGNGGDTTPFYPAATSGVVSVAATTAQDTLWAASGHGDWLTLAAPGEAILSTYLDGYLQATGTSFAAPHVAAVAAMVRAVDPSLSVAEVETILSASATDLGATGWDGTFGHGRLDAAAAVAMAAEGAGPPASSSCESLSALIVVGRTVAGVDQAVGDRLAAAGFGVTFVPAADLSVPAAAAYDLVLLSATARERDLPAGLAAITVPVFTFLPDGIELLGMSGSRRNTDSGKLRRADSIDIVSGHPLAGGLQGSVRMVSATMDLLWARPADSAVVAATLGGDAQQAAVFGYEAGSTMASGTAPERRGAMPLTPQALEGLTSEGWTLLEAAAAWSAGCAGG
jgi:subtilisin family serine protease